MVRLPARLEVALEGSTDLPLGKIAAIATFLEMREAPAMEERSSPRPYALESLARDVRRYRTLYRAVGEPWLWFSRLTLSEQRLNAVIRHAEVDALALTTGGWDIGLMELDFREPGACELTFFGLIPDAIGQGWGHTLMGEAIRRAFARPIERLWMHTCTLDHQGAVDFYRRSGFNPYRRAIEIADDPRLSGHLPASSARHCPPI